MPKKEVIIILPYLDKMSQIVKTRLTKTMSKNMKFCTLGVIFASKILFLKRYGQVLFINVRAEAAKPATLVRPIDIPK